MEQNYYDVVIVGSGIAGAIVAKTLTNSGKRVLMLEAGLEAGIALEGDAAYHTYHEYLQTFYKALAKTPNAPYPKIKNAPSGDVLDISLAGDLPNPPGYFVQKGPQAFASDNLIAGGGTTMHWLGTALRMVPNDFKMKSVYGQGVDWPLTYEELRPYYEMAEYEMGVSGNAEEPAFPGMTDDFFGPDYCFPMEKIPQSYLDKRMIANTPGIKLRMGNATYVLNYASTPQARNSIPNKNYTISGVQWQPHDKKLHQVHRNSKTGERYVPVGAIWDSYTGQRCEGNACCVPICPVQAKYNAMKTLKPAMNSTKGSLDIVGQAVAYDLKINKETKEIEGVQYKRYTSSDSAKYTTHTAKGKIYVLAANAIENAKLLLAANAANSSDQVGRNLMDHLTLLTWGLFPEKVYPFRAPNATSNITTFREGNFRKEHSAWNLPVSNWGWAWSVFSPGADVAQAVNEGLFGKALRTRLNDTLTKQVLLQFECEQIPDPENRVTIDPNYKDQLGNYRPVIHYRVSPYELKAFEAAKGISDQLFAANGIVDYTVYSSDGADQVSYNGKNYTYKGAGHLVGTHRMGHHPKDSVVNKEQRTWDHANLYLVGCGNMPTLGTSNPTLTMAALTFKAAEAILTQLEK